MEYLKVDKNGQEWIYKIKEEEGIKLPKGTICFLLGRSIDEKEGFVKNNFRETEDYYIVSECSVHSIFSKKDNKLLFQSLKIHEIRFFISENFKKENK